jgi:hypothetical protein
MDKKKYYLSIHAGPNTVEIRDVKGESTYDFEIEASDDEVDKLEELFEHAYSDDFKTYSWMHVIADKKIEKLTEDFDQTLNNIYQIIYDLGTEKTRSDITEMGVLNSLN